MNCPTCKTIIDDNSKECNSCGLIFEKYYKREQERIRGSLPSNQSELKIHKGIKSLDLAYFSSRLKIYGIAFLVLFIIISVLHVVHSFALETAKEIGGGGGLGLLPFAVILTITSFGITWIFKIILPAFLLLFSLDLVLCRISNRLSFIIGLVGGLLLFCYLGYPKIKAQMESERQNIEKMEETKQKLFGTTPFYEPTIIKYRPIEWKIIDGNMDFESASEVCGNHGSEWGLPSRDELLIIIPDILESQKNIWRTNNGIKTSNPNVVISLLPYEREAKPKYLNNVVCVGAKISFKHLSGKNWERLPILANFFDARRLCEKRRSNWKIPKMEDWEKIKLDLPLDEIGFAWTNSVVPGRWKDPKEIYFYDIKSQEFKTFNYYDVSKRRLLTFCIGN